MMQPSLFSKSKLSYNIVLLLILYFILTLLPLGYAQDNSNNFVFTGLNGISNKSDSIFYNDNNPAQGKPPASYNAAVGRKLSDGVEVTATSSQYPVKLIPITLTQSMGTRTGSRITYAAAPGVHIIYAFKGNGVKEDIVFDHPTAAPLDLAFRMELDPMLEAHLDNKGNVVIYGPNLILSGFIQTGDSKSAELILKARQHAPKDNLLYIIPAPVIIDGGGKKHKNLAHYTLEKSIFILHATALADLPAPVSIDPSIVVTSTTDFMKGNNEGMISFDTDAISRAVPSGGSIGNWTATTGFTTPRNGHTSVAYNGYLYVIGGINGSTYLNDVQFAPINANGTIGSWTATTSFAMGRYAHTSVTYNGYLYVIGGYNGLYLNDVQFAPINANGTIGSWTTTTSLTTPRAAHTSVAYNGYLYIIGGFSSSILNDVQFAPINANGTIGAWSATTSFSTARFGHTSIAYNGYLYVIGGLSGTGFLNDVQFASINANGTVGAWFATTSFTTARYYHTSVAYNGYLYIIGGYNASLYFNDVQFVPINTNGTLGTWTTTTSFTTMRKGHTSIANNGYLYIIGGADDSGSFNDVQFAPINANGNVGAWTATTSFTTPRYLHTSVAYNGYLYILGGFDGTNRLNDVQFAPINANGTVGSWTATTAFTTPRYGHTSTVYNGYIYVIGGTSGVYLNDVQFAPINTNGTVGSWTTTTSFTTARCFHASVTNNGYLYIIGGYAGSPYFNDVQFAPINADGTVGSWTTTTSFTGTRRSHTSIAYNGYLYVLGGTYGTTYLNDVQFAPIDANGTVGTWTATTSFTTGRYAHISAAYNGYMYVLGGYNGPGSYLDDVQFAPINSNGTLGAWNNTTSFPISLYAHTSAVYNGYLYVLGGSISPGSYLNDVRFALLSANGTLGAWTATTSFSTPRNGHASVAFNGYLYVIGGFSNSTFYNDVQYAPINANGTVGAWIATTSFSAPRYGHASVAFNGYLYVIGGFGSEGYLSDVQYAPIFTDGTVGAWTATTSFMGTRDNHTSIAFKGYLYVIGGFDGSPHSDIQFAPINTNGTIGAWTFTNSFPGARFHHASVAYNGFLYVIGGASIGPLNDVQFAAINSNGTVGAWTTTTSFPVAREGHTAAASNSYLYIMGGFNPTSFLNDVQFAPINSNGTIGSWTAASKFNASRNLHTSAAYNGYLYILGGYNGTSYFNDVQFATLNGPAARARYSKLLNIGSDQIIESIQFSNSGAKGITNLTHTLAPSGTAVFGSRTTIPGALSGMLYTTGLNTCGRYMWIHFDLDDTLSATIDGGGLNGRGDLLDFTVTYNPLSGVGTSLLASKSASNVHLSWSASPGASSYNVLRCNAAASPCTPVTIASPATNSYDDPALSDSTNYWYRIEAVNGACVSP